MNDTMRLYLPHFICDFSNVDYGVFLLSGGFKDSGLGEV